MHSFWFKQMCTMTLAIAAAGAMAQAPFPERPVRMIVTWPAGGPVDVGARAVAQGLSERFKQSFVVDNRPGANGIIGTDAGARAAADGYTVIVGNVETLALNPHVYQGLKYNPLIDLEPVAMMGRLPLALVLRSEFAAANGTELIQLVKSKPKQFTYGSWGVGSIGHLGVAMAEQIAGLDMLHVPYQGGAPAQAALMANQIDMLLVQVPFAEQQQKAGKMKLVGLTSEARSPQYPHLPTLSEQGFKGLNAEQWVAFFVPAHTPANVKQQLTREIADYVSSAKGTLALKQIGFDPSVATPVEITGLVRREYDRWGAVVRDKGIQAR